VDKKYLNFIIGGVNYFPSSPKQEFTSEIDALLSTHKDNVDYEVTTIDLILEVLQLTGANDNSDWDNKKYRNCVQSLNTERPSIDCRLIIRRNRSISKGTGTLLSQNDRILGERFPNSLVITLYRLTGTVLNGWDGQPFWILNIKFPSDFSFYDTIN